MNRVIVDSLIQTEEDKYFDVKLSINGDCYETRVLIGDFDGLIVYQYTKEFSDLIKIYGDDIHNDISPEVTNAFKKLKYAGVV